MPNLGLKFKLDLKKEKNLNTYHKSKSKHLPLSLEQHFG